MFLQMNLKKEGKTMNTVSKKHIFFTGLMLFSFIFWGR
ncbi:Branched-chain amino acid transport protein [Bacillus thuringiensis serovar sotto str. T04001]|nr:Branched-chain amino acid transport protein [Bacillus thuringiensis serovar sotto str. T04001]